MIMAIFTASVRYHPRSPPQGGVVAWKHDTGPPRAFLWSGCSPTTGILTVPTDRRVPVGGHVRPITPTRLRRVEGMSVPIRVMVEQGKKKAVASAFDWPGWDRGGKSEDDAVTVLATYRPRYAKVAQLARLADEFVTTGEMEVVERVQGTGMTDFYGVSARSAGPEQRPMSEAECERKIALLRACWAYFDDVASRVSAELRKGPRGGGRDRDRIVRHTNGAEISEFAKKVGVITGTSRLAEPARASRPPRRVLRGDPRVQRPGRLRSDLDRPVRDPAMPLPHAGPRVGDGGQRPVRRILTASQPTYDSRVAPPTAA